MNGVKWQRCVLAITRSPADVFSDITPITVGLNQPDSPCCCSQNTGTTPQATAIHLIYRMRVKSLIKQHRFGFFFSFHWLLIWIQTMSQILGPVLVFLSCSWGTESWEVALIAQLRIEPAQGNAPVPQNQPAWSHFTSSNRSSQWYIKQLI